MIRWEEHAVSYWIKAKSKTSVGIVAAFAIDRKDDTWYVKRDKFRRSHLLGHDDEFHAAPWPDSKFATKESAFKALKSYADKTGLILVLNDTDGGGV